MTRVLNLYDLRKMDQKQVRGGQEYRVNCQFCDDSNYHMYVNETKGVFHCFKCETSGVIIGSPAFKEQGLISEEVKARITNLFRGFSDDDMKLISPKEVNKSLPRNDFLTGFKPLESGISRTYFEAWDYLRNRGLSDSEIKGNDIRYSIQREGIFSNTVIFPIYEDSSLKYFVCRKILHNDHKGPKYINASWPKEDILFRPWRPAIVRAAERLNHLIICEGVFDAIAIQRVINKMYGLGAHLPGVAALLGKRATHQQIKRLNGFSHLSILLDPDAYTYAVRLIVELHNWPGEMTIRTSLIQLDNEDPGSVNPRTLEDLIRADLSKHR